MRATRTFMFVMLCAIALVFGNVRAEPVGTAFTYQGQLKEAGVPVNETCNFEFTLWDDPTSTDASHQVGPSIVFHDINGRGPVEVNDGLFTVELDFGQGVFDGHKRWLGVGVKCPATTNIAWIPTRLSPRQPVTATPYALYAAGGPGGTGEFWAANGDNIYNTNAANVGIGTDAPVATLQVLNTAGGHTIWAEGPNIGLLAYRRGTTGTWPAIHAECDSLTNGTSGIRGKITTETPGVDASGVYGINAGTGENGNGVRGYHAGGGVGVKGETLTGIGVYGIATADSGTTYGLRGETTSPDGYAGYFIGNRNYFMGRVGIGAGAIIPDAQLHVHQRGLSTPALHIATRSGDVPFYDHIRVIGNGIDGWTSPAIGTPALRLNPNVDSNLELVAGGGVVNVGSYPSKIMLDPNQDVTGGGVVEVRNNNGNTTVRLDGQAWADAGTIELKKGNGDYGMILYAEELPYHGGSIVLRNSPGHGSATTVQLKADRYGDGHGWVIADEMQTDILHILGGADLSEQFDVHAGDNEVKPGMVVSIDPDQPGKLAVSREAYDKKVAGIISGAGGVDTGLMMGQSGTVADGDHPVALTGRVYCLCDATDAPIQPGDLLTTSDTPGHAMAVEDYTRAQGSIIGKAMTSLKDGQGLVLVLVTLQ